MNKNEAIKSLTGKWAPLSNFWMETEGHGKSAEHIFQAAKTESREERAKILSRPKPGQAKHAGKRCTLREDWELIKVNIMEEIVRRKFRNETLRALLEETGDAEIVEGNRWHDNFWGQCSCANCAKRAPGKNTLGNILMTIREENRRNA
jgi:ribA/ribD-fused uncharacterized protein